MNPDESGPWDRDSSFNRLLKVYDCMIVACEDIYKYLEQIIIYHCQQDIQLMLFWVSPS